MKSGRRTKDESESPYTISDEDVHESMLASSVIATDNTSESDQSESEKNAFKCERRKPVKPRALMSIPILGVER